MYFGILEWGYNACLASGAAVELAAAEGHRSLIPGYRYDHRNSVHHKLHGYPEWDSGDPGRPCQFQGLSGTFVDLGDKPSGDLDTLGLGMFWYPGRLHVGRI